MSSHCLQGLPAHPQPLPPPPGPAPSFPRDRPAVLVLAFFLPSSAPHTWDTSAPRHGSHPQSPVRTLADGNKSLLHLSLKPLPASLSQQKLTFSLDTVPATFSNRGFLPPVPSGLESGEAEECGCLHFPPNCAHLVILWPSQSFYSH